ncbi:uncharacterized protein LOC116045431 isoform X1 [Sander lucioperca]|uniref:uncharacterized protein LOC116045431 isoform X1 n=1 Tax=Sander lucioperca TaxID=283035 RepID=UPI00125DA835|nr:uncharacterized protein LOC116045431 isoform X1 [Sander lucioperca]
MDNSTVKQNKKGKNKGHKNILLNEWLFTYDEAIIAALKRPPQTTPKTILTKETETVKGGQKQQAVTSTDAPQSASKLKVATTKPAPMKILKRTIFLQQEITIKDAPQPAAKPKFSPLQAGAIPKDTPQKVASTKRTTTNVTPKDVPLKGATPKPVKVVTLKDLQQEITIKVGPQQASATPERVSLQTIPTTILTKETETVKGGQPQQAVTSTDAPPERVSLQANTPSGAAQQVCEASDLTTGPVLRKTSWSATQPHRTSKQEQLARVWAGIVEANDYKQGPIQQKELWTPTSPKERSGRVGDNRKPHWTSSQFCQLSEALSSEAMASGDEASDFMSCLMQQKNICTAPHTTQACDEVEASSQHAMTVVPELNTLKEETQALRSSLQQASCDNKKLKDENKALRAEVKELNKAQEVTVEKVKKITDLVVQIRSKRVSEAETRRNLEQEEEALHRQKEMEVSLAQEREKNELKDQLATRQQKGNTRPKKTSLWKRFLRMFA